VVWGIMGKAWLGVGLCVRLWGGSCVVLGAGCARVACRECVCGGGLLAGGELREGLFCGCRGLRKARGCAVQQAKGGRL
jgi:hypothetical protein